MGWAFVPVILVLSIITMCRGGIFRGILLLCGAPLAIFLAAVIGASVVVTAHEADQEERAAKTARSNGVAQFPSLTMPANAPQRRAEPESRFAPPALAEATTRSAVEAVRKDAIAKLSRVTGLSEARRSALLREIQTACDKRIDEISFANERKRLR